MKSISQPVPAIGWFAHGRDLAWPREHGSWSLALEPIVLGLLVAPSVAGGWFALAVLAGFFTRRPLKIALRDTHAERRAAARTTFGGLAIVALGFFLVALAGRADAHWLAWLAPIVAGAAVFLWFDVRGEGREEIAEITGAATFACVPAVLAAIAGRDPSTAIALTLVIGGRSVPTVLAVRAMLRAQKTGELRAAPALIAAWAAMIGGVLLARAGFAPRVAAGLFALLALRATALLVWPRPTLRARTIGIFEAALGVIFVLSIAWAWRS